MELSELLNAKEIIAQIISFLLVLFLLRAFAWKKLLKLLDDRKERIASEFKSIKEAKEDISQLKAEYDTKLSAIEDAARLKIQEAINEGRVIAQEIKEKSQNDAKIILAKAKENIEIEISKAKEELKEKVVDLTISATEHIIREKMTAEKDKKLVSEFLEELDKVK